MRGDGQYSHGHHPSMYYVKWYIMNQNQLNERNNGRVLERKYSARQMFNKLKSMFD